MVSALYMIAVAELGQLYNHVFSLGSVFGHVSREEEHHNGTTNHRKVLDADILQTCCVCGLSLHSTW